MKLSIIVPSYNQAAYIGRTIESILSQDDKNLELIVMDGGSTDATLAVLAPYRDQIDILVSQKDGGQSDALQKGLGMATGDFIGWQNSDDIYLPDAFRLFREKLRHDLAVCRAADVYFGNLCVMDANDRTLYRKIYGPFRPDYLRYVGWNITNQSCFFSRSKLAEIGGFNATLQYAMDFDLYMRLAAAGARFSWLDQYLAGFRIHGESKGSTLHATREREYRRLRAQYIPGYNPDLPWSRQFRLRRWNEKLRRLTHMVLAGTMTRGVAGKWGVKETERIDQVSN